MNHPIAEMLRDGRMCEECGRCWRERALGYPATCDRCLPSQSKELPGISLAVFNNGHHFKYGYRWNYWPRHRKWHDSLTGVTGQGLPAFKKHVKASLKAHRDGQIQMARQ